MAWISQVRWVDVGAWAMAWAASFFFIPTVAAAASHSLLPADGYGAVDFLPDEWPSLFCVFGDDVAIFSPGGGLEIVDRANPTSRQSWGSPSGYEEGWGSFLTPDPSGASLWVGFTVDDNVDDRIYQVDAGGWHHRATLVGNFDLEFFGGNAYVSANPGAIQNPFEPRSSLYLLDRSGGNQHDLLAEVGGYSAGLGVDGSGNVYYGTQFLDGSENKMVRFSAAQMAAAVGPGNLTLGDAEALFVTSAGGCDVDVDDAGNVVFDENGGAGGQIRVWRPTEGGGILATLATTDAGASWLTLVDVIGDVTSAGGRVFGLDWYESGIAEVIRLIPGDADGDGAVGDGDAAILAAHWGQSPDMTWGDGDFDGDGSVGAADASLLAANWGASLSAVGEAAGVPEPGVGAMAVAAMCLALALHHRDAEARRRD